MKGGALDGLMHYRFFLRALFHFVFLPFQCTIFTSSNFPGALASESEKVFLGGRINLDLASRDLNLHLPLWIHPDLCGGPL
jgi:hypothetical protein